MSATPVTDADRAAAIADVESAASTLVNLEADLSEARAERDRAVRAARSAGVTLEEIGRALGGLTKQRVHDIASGRYGS